MFLLCIDCYDSVKLQSSLFFTWCCGAPTGVKQSLCVHVVVCFGSISVQGSEVVYVEVRLHASELIQLFSCQSACLHWQSSCRISHKEKKMLIWVPANNRCLCLCYFMTQWWRQSSTLVQSAASQLLTGRDLKRLVKKAESVLGRPLDPVEVGGDDSIISDGEHHPVHDSHLALDSSFNDRLLHPGCVKERYRKSFLLLSDSMVLPSYTLYNISTSNNPMFNHMYYMYIDLLYFIYLYFLLVVSLTDSSCCCNTVTFRHGTDKVLFYIMLSYLM